MPWWWNGIHIALKMLRLNGIEGSTPSRGTKREYSPTVEALVLEIN